MLIDIHAHLNVKEFDRDRAVVIERARKAGVLKLVNVGFDVEGNFQALALAKKYDFIYATMGIHPHLASEWNEEVGARIMETVLEERAEKYRRLKNKKINSSLLRAHGASAHASEAGSCGSQPNEAEPMKRKDKIVALGEMGLDYYKNFQPRQLQQKVFHEQLKLARELDLPVIIHCRDAFSDAFRILDEEKVPRVLMHCYTGTLQEARECWGRGYYTAFTGIITYPSAKNLHQVVRQCPLDKLLIETDCPFLAPQGHRSERNEPAYLLETFEKVVAIKCMEPSGLEVQIENTVKNLFGI